LLNKYKFVVTQEQIWTDAT